MKFFLVLVAGSFAVLLSCGEKDERSSSSFRNQGEKGRKSSGGSQSDNSISRNAYNTSQRNDAYSIKLEKARSLLRNQNTGDLKSLIMSIHHEGIKSSLLNDLALNVEPSEAKILVACIIETLSPEEIDGPLTQVIETIAPGDLKLAAEIFGEIGVGDLRDKCLESIASSVAASAGGEVYKKIEELIDLFPSDYERIRMGVISAMTIKAPRDLFSYLQSEDVRVSGAAKEALAKIKFDRLSQGERQFLIDSLKRAGLQEIAVDGIVSMTKGKDALDQLEREGLAPTDKALVSIFGRWGLGDLDQAVYAARQLDEHQQLTSAKVLFKNLAFQDVSALAKRLHDMPADSIRDTGVMVLIEDLVRRNSSEEASEWIKEISSKERADQAKKLINKAIQERESDRSVK